MSENTEWLTHDAHPPLNDLAPAQLVWFWSEGEDPIKIPASEVEAFEEAAWPANAYYRPALSANGNWLCSGEGLEPGTRWVFTPSSGFPAQSRGKPVYRDGFWFAHKWGYAPATHRRPGPASESLMEVNHG